MSLTTSALPLIASPGRGADVTTLVEVQHTEHCLGIWELSFRGLSIHLRIVVQTHMHGTGLIFFG